MNGELKIANAQFLRRGYLKKQTQFSNGRNDVKSILTMFYGDFNGQGRRENKANSKPNKANLYSTAGTDE